MNTIKYTIPFVVLLLLVGQVGVEAAPLGTGFTYQGQLKLDGRPAHDTCDLTFSLWEAAVGPPQVGSTQVRNNFNVSNGLITTKLDFGNVFDGSTRWLEVRVRCPAGFGGYATLSPRQELTAGPYALFAMNGDGNTLDEAYDQGGSGAGRTITADSGALNIAGPDGLTVNGYVGIGTTVRSARLHVVDDVGSVVLGHNTSTNGFGATGVMGRSESTNQGAGVKGWASASSGFAVGVIGQTDSPVGYAGYFLGGRNFFEGNVGIGTLNPVAKLHIEGTPGVDGIKFPDGTVQTTAAVGGGGDGHSLDAADGNPVDAVYVDNAGKVGIGTTTPIYELQVDGDIQVGYSDHYRVGAYPGLWWNSVTGSVAIGATNPVGLELYAGSTTPRMFIDEDTGRVGIGTTNPATRLHVEHSVADEETIRAVHTAVSDDTPAVLGQHNITDDWGIGVRGVGGLIGVQGEVQGGVGGFFGDYVGVEGIAESDDGRIVGVSADATSVEGDSKGVEANADSVSGWSYGVEAYADSETGYSYGVDADADSVSGRSYGVRGDAHSDTGNSYGLYGHAGTDTMSSRGVYGTAHADTGGTAYGVYGTTSGTTGTLWAGYFDGRGYFESDVGIGTDAPDGRLDVRGGDLIMDSGGGKLRLRLDSTGDGWGFATAGGGAHLWLQEIPAGGGTSTRVSFQSGGNVGIGTTSPGAKLDVRGSVRVRSNSGVRVDNSTGSERAVMFVESAGKGALWLRGPNGNLNVTLRGQNGNHNVGTIVVYDSAGADQASMWVHPTTGLGHLSADVKSFKVANPRDPATDIWYVSLEGPEAGAYYRGTATLTDGTAVVVFPEHFQDVVSTTQMTVQLTPRSAASWGLACTHVDGQGLVVQELNEGKGNYEFDYVVTDVRKGLENWEVIKKKGEFGPRLGEPIHEATGSAATAADPTDVETELADGFAETNPPTIRDDPGSVDSRDSIRPIREIIRERDAELAGQRSQIADLMARLERLERRLPKVDSEKRGR